MGTKGSVNKQKIVQAADRLFYTRGYNQTSFSDISDETGIPRGNFYYYFKTKEDILSAVVEERVEAFRQMLHQCDVSSNDPRGRLLCFVEQPLTNIDQVIQYGCPIGTLSSELSKEQDHEISRARITAVFDLLLEWCMRQFADLGKVGKARDLSLDLLARMQGMTIIANVYTDEDYLQRATREATAWLKSITSQS